MGFNLQAASALLFAALFTSCTGRKEQQTYPFHYNLSVPDEHIRLPKKLREISGIDIYNGDNIVAVQDELGKIYVYDVKKDKLRESIGFATDNDYEAIAVANDSIFVLRSNGNIYEILKFDSLNQQSVEYKNFLNKENNTEGLCYDKENNRLLIACKDAAAKGHGKKSQRLSGYKAIYAFSLATHTVDKEPAYLIDIGDVRDYISSYDIGDSTKRGGGFWTKDEDDFAPSDLAINPITHDLYVLCSRGKLLIVLDKSGKINYIHALNPHIFRQPEGITFFPNGDMLISDEGKEHRANILKFSYR